MSHDLGVNTFVYRKPQLENTLGKLHENQDHQDQISVIVLVKKMANFENTNDTIETKKGQSPKVSNYVQRAIIESTTNM